MNLQRCEDGHFYDADKHSSCPYCKKQENELTNITVEQTDESADEGKTAELESDNNLQKTDNQEFFLFSENNTIEISTSDNLTKDDEPAETIDEDDEENVTITFMDKIDPVVGWLICIKGPEFGQDFKIKADVNYIGRDDTNDIVIFNDEFISRKRHAAIIYDPVDSKYYAYPGDSTSLFYLNDNLIIESKKIEHRDILTIGKSKFMFIPCCDKDFRWDRLEQEEGKQ